MKSGLFTVLSGAIVAAATLNALPASAGTLNLGTAADYAIVDLGDGKTIGQNSGPVDGAELLGNGVTAAFSGGNNGGISGGLYYDSTTGGQSTFGMLQNPPTTTLVSGPGAGTVTGTALADANEVAAYAAGLTPTQTFGALNGGSLTITGTAGLNVIDITSIQNVTLTLSGPANAIFVIDVTGNNGIQTNEPMSLTGGVTAGDILWNLEGTSGNILQTSGGDVLYGTFLAADGGNFQFSELDLTGALINTDGGMQFVSGSKIPDFVPFSPRVIPEPSTWVMMLLGFAGLGYAGYRKARSAVSTA